MSQSLNCDIFSTDISYFWSLLYNYIVINCNIKMNGKSIIEKRGVYKETNDVNNRRKESFSPVFLSDNLEYSDICVTHTLTARNLIKSRPSTSTYQNKYIHLEPNFYSLNLSFYVPSTSRGSPV